jgi:CheY-like chemotaxis protein
MSGKSPAQVLVAEDNALNQKIVAHMLRGLPCEVEIVDIGAKAVAAVAHKRYDVVLMDNRMPEMDGLEATRRVRRLLPVGAQPRIYALTAGTWQEERQECTDAGMDGFLAKPLRRDELAALVEQVHALETDE